MGKALNYCIANKQSRYYEIFDVIYNESLSRYNHSSNKKAFIEVVNVVLKEYNICKELYYPILDEIVEMRTK